MNRKVRMGLLGCGVISQYAHLGALKKADGVDLVAVCDVAEDLARLMAAHYDVPAWYGEYGAFLEDEGMEAVLVATTDQCHVANARECLRHGKHVLVEKPLGANADECRGLIDEVATSGLKLQVGNMKRYDPGIQSAARFISEDMGERLSVNGWYCDSTLRPPMQRSLRLPPLRSPEQQGFDPAFRTNKRAYKLVTHGCHLVNTLRFFGGEIAALQARVVEKSGNLSWHGLLEYADGAVGHFELTTAAQGDWREGFWVHGQHGSVEVQSFLPFFNRPSAVRIFDARRCEYRSPFTPDSDPYERQIEAFARAILEDRPVSPDVYDGVADLAVLRAVAESCETGDWVEVGRDVRAGALTK